MWCGWFLCAIDIDSERVNAGEFEYVNVPGFLTSNPRLDVATLKALAKECLGDERLSSDHGRVVRRFRWILVTSDPQCFKMRSQTKTMFPQTVCWGSILEK